MKFFSEFKEFIARGSAIDLAVGVVIGSAFTAIVNSLVSDIINPFIAFLANLFRTAAADATGGATDSLFSMTEWVIPGTEIKIGSFIGAVINFIIIAFVIFCLVKGINALRSVNKKEEETPPPPPSPTQEELLIEIRDLLKEKE